MMERRGWPWRKKSSEKIASAPFTTDSSQAYESNQNDEQDTPRVFKDHTKTPDATTQLQQAEARLKSLNEQLSATLVELSAKDQLVQQHTKVAEEAVTGWEKAESEAATLKQQLDVSTQQKLATEDRVSHLDGALKECMRQLRHVREEQEQRIHDTVVKKTREWEKVRAELESKLSDVGNQLLEAGAENSAMTKSLQERARRIIEANEAKARAEGEVRVLQVRLDAVEKDNSKLKYELHVLSKELEIRSEEREYNKKVGEAASKQHLENVKKIAKLETECQRLRLLVRKRLPGPAAVAQMRLEVEALGIATGERGRRMSPNRRNSSSQAMSPMEAAHFHFQENSSKEASDRLLAMEDETKSLKEVLVKRNNELHAARLMCARTASKLSNVEEQLENVSRTHGTPKLTGSALDGYIESSQTLGSSKEASVASVSEDGGADEEASCAESWASALISELAHFRKKKVGLAAGKELASSSNDLMDDFAEMEKLASMPLDSHANISGEAAKVEGVVGRISEDHSGGQMSLDDRDQLEVAIRTKEELESVNQLSKELKNKLAHAEKRLVMILESETEEKNLSRVLEEVRAALEDMKDSKPKQLSESAGASYRSCLDTESPEVRDTRVWSPSGHSSCHSEESSFKQDMTVPTVKVSSFGPDLAAAVRKVVCLVEGLSQSDWGVASSHFTMGSNSENDLVLDDGDSQGHTDLAKQWRSSEFDSCIQSLVTLCNSLLQGKVDIIDFMSEVVSSLDWLVGHIFALPDKSPETSCIRRRLDWNKGSSVASNSETVCAKASFAPPLCKSSSLNKENIVESHVQDPALLSIPFASVQPRIFAQDEEFQKIVCEKEALARNLETQIKRVACIEDELAQLKSEKDEADHKYKIATEELECLKTQLRDSKLNAMELQCHLTAALEKKQSLEDEMADLLSSKESLKSRLCEAKAEVKKLEENAVALGVQLQEETQCRKEIEIKFEEHQRQLHSTVGGSQSIMKVNEATISGLAADEEAAKLKKEREIAAATEKLAECQQTILVLGKQLKALGAPKEIVEASHSSPVDLISSFTKMPLNQHRLHTSSDQVQCESETTDASYPRSIDCLITSPVGYRRPRSEGERRLEYEGNRGSIQKDSGFSTQRGQNGGRHEGVSYGQQLSPEMYRGNVLLSPLHGDYQEGPVATASSPSDQVMSSPGRSPARFLSLRSRGPGGQDSYKSDSSSEKHATGFSRFFSRNRNGH